MKKWVFSQQRLSWKIRLPSKVKSIKRLIQAHEVQLVNYLVAANKPVGLLLNFGERKVEVKRKVKDLNLLINRKK